MDVAQIVLALQHAKGPDRNLDLEIAKLLGFRRTVKEIPTGRGRPPAKRVIWLKPDGTPERVPAYTQLVDSAIELASLIAPHNVGGCSWEEGRGSAKINNGPYVHAANPALALCAAALQLMWSLERDNGR